MGNGYAVKRTNAGYAPRTFFGGASLVPERSRMEGARLTPCPRRDLSALPSNEALSRQSRRPGKRGAMQACRIPQFIPGSYIPESEILLPG